MSDGTFTAEPITLCLRTERSSFSVLRTYENQETLTPGPSERQEPWTCWNIETFSSFWTFFTSSSRRTPESASSRSIRTPKTSCNKYSCQQYVNFLISMTSPYPYSLIPRVSKSITGLQKRRVDVIARFFLPNSTPGRTCAGVRNITALFLTHDHSGRWMGLLDPQKQEIRLWFQSESHWKICWEEMTFTNTGNIPEMLHVYTNKLFKKSMLGHNNWQKQLDFIWTQCVATDFKQKSWDWLFRLLPPPCSLNSCSGMESIHSVSLNKTSHAPIGGWFDSNSANKQKIDENVVFQHDARQDENLVWTFHLNKALGLSC